MLFFCLRPCLGRLVRYGHARVGCMLTVAAARCMHAHTGPLPGGARRVCLLFSHAWDPSTVCLGSNGIYKKTGRDHPAVHAANPILRDPVAVVAHWHSGTMRCERAYTLWAVAYTFCSFYSIDGLLIGRRAYACLMNMENTHKQHGSIFASNLLYAIVSRKA